MKLFAILAAAALTVAAQSQPTVFKRNAINAATTPTVSANFQNIGQAVHIMMAYFPTATADVTGYTLRIEGSFDNITYFPISEDLTTAVYNGTYSYAITRANGVYPYVRFRYVTAHATLPLTAHYTGAIQPIGLVKLSGTRYLADSPLSGARQDGLYLVDAGSYYVYGRRMTPIVPAEWTSVNLNASSTRTDNADGSISLAIQPTTGWNFVCKALPSSPYVIRAHWLNRTVETEAGGSGLQSTGIALRNSSTGLFVAAYWELHNTWIVGKWSNPTTGVAVYQNDPYRNPEAINSIQVTDDGTYRYIYFWDGKQAYKARTDNNERSGRTDWTTPDQICFGAYNINGNYRARITPVGYDVNPTW